MQYHGIFCPEAPQVCEISTLSPGQWPMESATRAQLTWPLSKLFLDDASICWPLVTGLPSLRKGNTLARLLGLIFPFPLLLFCFCSHEQPCISSIICPISQFSKQCDVDICVWKCDKNKVSVNEQDPREKLQRGTVTIPLPVPANLTSDVYTVICNTKEKSGDVK